MEWQVVGEPEQDGDEWTVVFRMDGLYREPSPAAYVLESDSADIDSARECAEETVNEFAADPGYWKWDGTAESKGLKPVPPEVSK